MQKKTLFVREFDVIFDCLMEDLITYGECSYKVKEGINPTVLSAYLTSKNNGNSIIDFGDDLTHEEVEYIVPTLRKYGIKEFTLSATSVPSNVISTLAEFRKFGFVVRDMIDINDFNGATVPALLVKVE